MHVGGTVDVAMPVVNIDTAADVDPVYDDLAALMASAITPEDALARLLGVRPAWHVDAACRGRADVNWFPTRGEDDKPAKEICAGCPVRDECERAGAFEIGIWGGVSGRQRRRAHLARRRGAA